MKSFTRAKKLLIVSIGVVRIRSILLVTLFATKFAIDQLLPDSLVGIIFDGYMIEFSRR